MKVAIITQATGKYAQLFPAWNKSLEKFLPATDKQILAFGVNCDVPAGFETSQSWDRYELFLAARSIISEKTLTYYLDVDMEVAELLSDDVIPPSDREIVAVRHFAHLRYGRANLFHKEHQWYSPSLFSAKPYWQACFFGGKSEAMLAMAESIAPVIRADKLRGLVTHPAIDELYFNTYWHRRPQCVHTLPATYASPVYRQLVKPRTQVDPAKIIHYNAALYRGDLRS